MPVKIFFCYAHEDEPLLNKLKTHLRPLQRGGLIDVWHDRDISAGTDWEHEIKGQLNSAQIILLLVSPDFMDSDYAYGIEMKRALERHERGEARVVPIILRHVYWQDVLGQLQALPKDGLPITDPDWYNIDRALYNVTEGIRKVVGEVTSKPSSPPPSPALPIQPSVSEPIQPPARVLEQTPAKPEPLVTPEDFTWLCTRTLKEHQGPVTSIAISPDGQTLASGSHDKTIKLWNLVTGGLSRTLTGHTKFVFSIAINPHEQTLASSSMDETIKLWNLQTGGFLRTLKEVRDGGAVHSIAISPDGQTLASGSMDRTIKLWKKK
jgi:WD40 repeat protein